MYIYNYELCAWRFLAVTCMKLAICLSLPFKEVNSVSVFLLVKKYFQIFQTSRTLGFVCDNVKVKVV